MGHRFSEITFTPSVVATQTLFGSQQQAAIVRQRMPAFEQLGERERSFIAARDSFYMATVTETGWPYIQHRGGKKGFLQVIDPQMLAFANFAGNGQFQTLGNLGAETKVALFLMDYPNRRRLKILGHAEFYLPDQLPNDLLLGSIQDPEHTSESVVLIRLDAFDWNCSQHIMPRYSHTEFEELS